MLSFFYSCLFVVFYTYIGYGLLIGLCVYIKRMFVKEKKHSPSFPKVTLFIAAYNEELFVEKKMRNSLDLDYPKGKLEILWMTDGSNDNTVSLLKNYPEAIVYHHPERKGKTAAINRGMPFATGDIIVFTDANTMINKEAILRLVAPFGDAKVGCVAGEKRIQRNEKDKASAGGEGIYWKYESLLKSLDSEFYSAVGAAGELFAIRKSLFNSLPEDTLLDDFVLSMRIAQQGCRIAYCKDAYAIEKPSKNMQEEEKRKVRIAAGGLQATWRLLPLLNLFRYGQLSFQYISHRVFRWTVAPVCLFILLPLNIFLVIKEPTPLLWFFCVAQFLFYLTASVGWFLSHKNIRYQLFFVPYYFLFMNFNVFKGIFYLRKNKNGIWEKANRQ